MKYLGVLMMEYATNYLHVCRLVVHELDLDDALCFEISPFFEARRQHGSKHRRASGKEDRGYSKPLSAKGQLHHLHCEIRALLLRTFAADKYHIAIWVDVNSAVGALHFPW